jgi:hypothetical protein
MDYRFLGKTGLKVSELCLGGMTMGREVAEDLSTRMLERLVAAGGNCLPGNPRQRGARRDRPASVRSFTA